MLVFRAQSTKAYTKGVPFLSKMVYKRVRGWIPERRVSMGFTVSKSNGLKFNLNLTVYRQPSKTKVNNCQKISRISNLAISADFHGPLVPEESV